MIYTWQHFLTIFSFYIQSSFFFNIHYFSNLFYIASFSSLLFYLRFAQIQFTSVCLDWLCCIWIMWCHSKNISLNLISPIKISYYWLLGKNFIMNFSLQKLLPRNKKSYVNKFLKLFHKLGIRFCRAVRSGSFQDGTATVYP